MNGAKIRKALRHRRVLICGSRRWIDRALIAFWIDELKPECVIEGEASGADSIAKYVANSKGIRVEPFPANWKQFGMSAGPIRNREMLKHGKPELVVAFHEDLYGESKGTLDMVKIALKAGITTILVDKQGEWSQLRAKP